MKLNHKLLLISFTEGASVMTAEICGAKLLAPYFGSSLYVWSSVMALTLGGLATGYFVGGQLSKKTDAIKKLMMVLVGAITCLCCMPLLNNLFHITSASFSLIPAVVISVFFLLFPVMFFMGATSPLIISLLTKDASKSGENSGKIYALSTVGGIIATFLCGLFLIPNIGVKATLLIFALVLTSSTLLLLPLLTSKKNSLILILPLSILGYSFTQNSKNPYSIFETDGIFGKLEVRDEPQQSNPTKFTRKLIVNNIIQTEMDLQTQESVSKYELLIKKNLLYFPKGKALALGIGGGVFVNLLAKNNYVVTGVEFDARIIDIAKHCFFLDKSINITCDDARHFINTSTEKYNLILIDLFKAEEQPSYVITSESLQKIKKLLDTNGIIIINNNGYLSSPLGDGTHCLLNTLRKAGFELKICTESVDEDYRNLLIIASLNTIDSTFNNELTPLIIRDIDINTDGKPVLEKLNAQANQRWRSNYLKNYILGN